jgi:peroxiredoxin
MSMLPARHTISLALIRFSLLLIIVVALLASSAIDPLSHSGFNGRIALAQDTEAEYEDEILKGKEMLRRRKYEDALKSFKRANDLKQKKSAECFNLMCEAYLGLGAYKNVVDNADKVIELAGDDKQLALKAYNNKGLALQSAAEKKDQKKLREAEAAFRQGISINASVPTLHYNLGVVLLQLNQDPEGAASLKQYMALQPKGPHAEDARRYIENPRRARENYAPDFSFTTSAGEHIALEDLRGKVVVLDFWGTWCPPCVESIPSLRNLHKRYSKEPSFILIGVSSDGDEAEWREFTEKNKMIWPQYLDRDRRVQAAFGVRAFPSYIVIDHEGIVRFQSIGSSWLKAANLDDAIRKQVKIVAKGVELN